MGKFDRYDTEFIYQILCVLCALCG